MSPFERSIYGRSGGGKTNADLLRFERATTRPEWIPASAGPMPPPSLQQPYPKARMVADIARLNEDLRFLASENARLRQTIIVMQNLLLTYPTGTVAVETPPEVVPSCEWRPRLIDL